MHNFELIPCEIVLIIFGLLQSKERSEVCSVSKLFEKLSIASSISLSCFPELFIEGKDYPVTNHTLSTIITQGDYHLIVRLKNKQFIDMFYWGIGIYKACKLGDLHIVKLLTKNSDDELIEPDWDEGLKGACVGGHLEIAKIMIEKGVNDKLYNGLKAACRYGQLEIVNMILSSSRRLYKHELYEMALISGVFYACKSGRSGVASLVVPEILKCQNAKNREETNDRFCPGCGKSATEHI
jgi:hypothetical protein